METDRILEIWKEKNIARVEFNFSCGGDSMGETYFQIWNNKEEEIEEEEIVNYFEENVYKNVDFYLNSDGNYQGESGTVIITLNDDDFNYSKSSSSEYSEQETFEVDVELTDEEVSFIKNYVSTINCSTESDNVNFNYSTDFIMTDELIEIESNLGAKLFQVASDFPFDKDEYARSFNYGNVFRDDELFGKLDVDTNTLTIELQIGYILYTQDEY